MKYESRTASSAAAAMAVTAAHFQLQYLDGFFSLKAEREKVFLGSRRGGGEYTVPEVRGYPGEELLKRGVVPDDVLNKKCLMKKHRKPFIHYRSKADILKSSCCNNQMQVLKKKASILLIKLQMTGSHLCSLLSNIAFRWIRPDVVLTWTDSRVLSSLPNTDLTSICCNLFSLSYFVPFAPHTVYHTLFSTLRITAVPLSCPRCPNRVKAQREDNRGTWTTVPLFVLPIILCYQCTCSPSHFLCYFLLVCLPLTLVFPSSHCCCAHIFIPPLSLSVFLSAPTLKEHHSK